MDDERVWAFEKSLWTGDALDYQQSIDDACLMVLPTPPFVMAGSEAVEAVTHTPRWTSVEIADRRVARPQEGLIVVAYHAKAMRDDQAYEAHCTSTYRRIAHEDWRVVQHQQTPRLAIAG
ncbi:MAG TPA: DUF4440 domain-containing protein [Sphingomonas sp.]|jgi:hypothetical protein|nr:DUF4440 domain-containing protein [Sphingomonas sp.]